MSKIVLISGSSRGLGAEIAKILAANGYKVAINYFKSEDAAMQLAAQLGENCSAFYADVSKKDDVINMISNIKECFKDAPAILINNALANYQFNGDFRAKAQDISWEEVQNQMDVTVKGSMNLIQSLIPDMSSKSYGKIINIGTNLFQNPVVPYHDYIIAKGALLALTRSFAKDLGQFGIRVNMISGGLLKVTDASSTTPDEVFDYISEQTPVGAVTTTEDFAKTILFFASNDSDAITGQNMTVDGGLTFN